MWRHVCQFVAKSTTLKTHPPMWRLTIRGEDRPTNVKTIHQWEDTFQGDKKPTNKKRHARNVWVIKIKNTIADLQLVFLQCRRVNASFLLLETMQKLHFRCKSPYKIGVTFFSRCLTYCYPLRKSPTKKVKLLILLKSCWEEHGILYLKTKSG